MKYSIEGRLEKTSWGLALDLTGTELENIGTRAWLDHSKNYKEYNIGEKYTGRIYFSIMYTLKELDDKGEEKETNNKNWQSHSRADLSEIKDFISSRSYLYRNVRDKTLSEKDIMIWFE